MLIKLTVNIAHMFVFVHHGTYLDSLLIFFIHVHGKVILDHKYYPPVAA
jgi:hypothetical protein